MTQLTATERFDKLPRWAREEFINLRRITREQEKRIIELAEGDPASDTYVQRHEGLIQGDHDLPLGVRPQIRFSMVKDPKITDYIQAGLVERNGVLALEVQGHTSISVQPWSTNLVRIVLEDR